MGIKYAYKRAIHLANGVLRAPRQLAQLMAERGELPTGSYRIGVYFGDSDDNIYQMRQWYEPLRRLAKQHPVVIISRHVVGAIALMRESELPVAFCRSVTDLERFLAQQPLDIILYVNQNMRNFQMLRYGNRLHVFINHGESDKVYMTTNQHKCYDYSLVAGDAARKRLSKALWEYDVHERTIAIGRPQADYFVGEAPYSHDGRTVVLYSPTWEGDRPAAHYGSVRSHGIELVRALLATGRHRVVYRPHPRSGVESSAFGEANKRIIAMLREANAKDPAAHHVYDESPALGWQLRDPDVAICDISAMIYDRLATGKPLLVTRPVDERAEVDERGYLSVCEWLAAADCKDIVARIDALTSDEEALARVRQWSTHYFGDTTPGEPTRRFEEAISTLLSRAEQLRGGTH